jgi:hypothetical protein
MEAIVMEAIATSVAGHISLAAPPQKSGGTGSTLWRADSALSEMSSPNLMLSIT